jgi:hypothetical protein
MSTRDLPEVVRYLKVLADETRLQLLGLLAARECSVGELAEILRLKEPTISHHLAKLADVELVQMRREGTVHLYRLAPDTLAALSRELFTPAAVAMFSPEGRVDEWEMKVLRTYVVDGRLKKIPDVRRKRDVILRWLATHFEEDRRYREREVNEVIGRYHPDFATLRRELIGARLMQRENGVYWRISTGAAAA